MNLAMQMLLFLSVLLCQSFFAISHMYITSPEARSTSSSIKSGPCGSETNDWSGTFTDVSPGILTITIKETIHHTGAPYRIGLSRYEDDTYNCILLDHIPQHSLGSKQDLYVNITIPNVNCSKCAIQVISFMTDKITDGTCCEYISDGTSGSCFSNYHSCANINILSDSTLNDYVSNRNDLICEQPSDWSYKTWNTNIYTQEESSEHWESHSSGGLQLIIPGNDEINPCGNVTVSPTISPIPSPTLLPTPPTTPFPTSVPTLPTTPLPTIDNSDEALDSNGYRLALRSFALLWIMLSSYVMVH